METSKMFILELFKMRTEAVCAALESSTDLGLASSYEFESLMHDLREAWCIETNEGSSDAD